MIRKFKKVVQSDNLVNITLTGLANAASMQSAEIDLSGMAIDDIEINFKLKAAATPVGSPAFVEFYVMPCTYGGNYGDALLNQNAPFTPSSWPNSKRIGQLNISSSGVDTRGQCGSLKFWFGGVLPRKFVIYATNNLGVALTSVAGENVVTWNPRLSVEDDEFRLKGINGVTL